MSALDFLHAAIGSLAITLWWFAACSLLLASDGGPGGAWPATTLGLLLAAPLVVLFNMAAYAIEKGHKERFVLRQTLATQHNTDVRLKLLDVAINKTFAGMI